MTALRPRESVESQNAWNLYGDITWYGILYGVVTSFLAVFTLRLGGSDTQVGLLTALPALVTALVSMPGSRFVERDRPLPVLVISGTLNRVGYLLIGLLPFLLATHRVDGLVLIVALLTIPGAIANIAFTTLFAQAVKPDRRAHVVSVRNVMLGITSTGAAFFGGVFLDWIVFPINYQLLFITAFAASMVSVYYLSRIRLPEPPGPVSLPAAPPRGPGSILALLRGSDAYARFTLTSFVFQWGLFFTSPLYSIYWIRNLQASNGWVGLINMVGSGTTILFYPLWGRLTARRGNRLAMIITTAALAGYPFFLAFSPTVEWAVLVSFWGGVFSSGQTLSFFNGLLEVCPERNHASYVGAYNSLANVAAFISPLISTTFTEIVGIQPMLLLGAGMRLFGSCLIWQQRVLAPRPRRR